ncbi:F0F1 ATP synthase subunit delta [Quisquiliibacterium transsilvanicum]|jgi:F-type H+-transporting ATPase subunit delta|uniref:ATP synthase subunit delta n=1 Tax=Quisquiliibacterium transsilvanicum TaxID=1549638 RepID=A0A7W8HIE7_9BURK|nr:F0F1 ATP synthase subunit delta [Quisquiliibacterium transsilvanicum]MBB5272642.1 F-type H+-transporting ATPase subunit delta [Quisquiliibacterium transsilvanicum]
MAESLTIARPYAEAAFKIARDAGALPAWSDALGRLAAVASSKAAQELVGNPRLTVAQVASVVADTAGQLLPDQHNFVRVLAENERMTVLPEIAEQFEALRNAHEGVLDAHVSSAFPLSEAQLAEVTGTLQSRYGRQVKVGVSIDPDLIGGVSIRIGDEVIDTSVRGKLAQLASALKV